MSNISTHQQALDVVAAQLCDETLSSRKLGSLGEDYAATWLAAQGWRILERNWHCRYGELDIVAVDDESRIVFVEVKTRRATRFGTPQEAVTQAKQKNLRRAAVQWLLAPEHRARHRGVRFDVITVVIQHGGQPAVHHIKEAF
ncbi:YraN family protein [Bifidobacterium panos]|uniref:UPF0102 protein G1C94_0083 n=1 Tax=Bifidobacterium panos TaxID=2675321 RepID=A0ABX1SXE8_9BIFI|nr:YraN family protein [Bifidobacterium sp. DSM 109963]NMN01462.1 hypothetical protein [Bifidobacterium sp. DSM 109963]